MIFLAFSFQFLFIQLLISSITNVIATPPTQVSLDTATSDQQNPRIRFYKNGNTLIQWISAGSDNSMGRVTDKNGAIIKASSTLFTLAQFSFPAMESMENGQMLLFGGYSSSTLVDVYTFDNSGSEIFHKYSINQVSSPGITDTFAGTFSGNDCILGWEQDGHIKILYLDKVESGLTSTESTITDTTSTENQKGQMLVLQDDTFVVTWQGVDSTTGKNIYAKHFNHDRTVKKNQFVVNTQADGEQISPTIAIFSDGTYIIAWQSDDNTPGIHALKFNSNSQAIGTQQTVLIEGTSLPDYEMKPQMAILSDDTFMLTWQKKEGTKFHVYMQKFNKNMIKIGLEARMNPEGSVIQMNSDIIGTKTGGFVLVYDQKSSSSENSQIYSTSAVSDFYYYTNGTYLSQCDTSSGDFSIEQTGPNVYTCKFKCEVMVGSFLQPNGYCEMNCKSPYIGVDSGVVKMCNPPCSQDQWYWSQSNSCLSSCDQPLATKIHQYFKECTAPCSSSSSKPFYFAHNETCQSECLPPYKKLSSALAQSCKHPCRENHEHFYYPHNTTCLETCSDPFKQTEENGIKYCKNECQNNGQCSYDFFPICVENTESQEPNQICSGCLTDGQCQNKFGIDKKYCNQNRGECQFCKINLECNSTTHSRCDSITGTCESCQTDQDCTHFNGEVYDYFCRTSLETNTKQCLPELTADQQTAKLMGTASTTISATATVASIALSSNPIILYFLTSFLQKFYYLLLLNINFPDFLRTFFKSFSFTRLSFLVVLISDGKEEASEVYSNFEKMGFTGSFLTNTGGVIIALILIMGITFGIKVLFKWFKVLKVINIYDKLYRKIFWDGVLIFIGLFAMEFTVTSFLQILTFYDNGLKSYISLLFAFGTIVGMINFIRYSFRNVKLFFRDKQFSQNKYEDRAKKLRFRRNNRRTTMKKNPKKLQNSNSMATNGINAQDKIPNNSSFKNMENSVDTSTEQFPKKDTKNQRPSQLSTQLSAGKSHNTQVLSQWNNSQQEQILVPNPNNQLDMNQNSNHQLNEQAQIDNNEQKQLDNNKDQLETIELDKPSYAIMINNSPKKPPPKRYENAFLVNKKALKEAYKEDRGKSANWFLKNKIPVTIAIRFIAGMAFPTFYFSVEVQLFFEFVCEIMLGAMIILCWKFTETMTSLMELLHSLTMFALLHVMALMSQKDLDKEQRDRYARVVIFIGTASLGLTIMLMIPNMIKDLKIKLKNSCKKRKYVANEGRSSKAKTIRRKKSKRISRAKLGEVKE